MAAQLLTHVVVAERVSTFCGSLALSTLCQSLYKFFLRAMRNIGRNKIEITVATDRIKRASFDNARVPVTPWERLRNLLRFDKTSITVRLDHILNAILW